MDAYSPCSVAALLDYFTYLDSVTTRSLVIDAGSGDYFFPAAAGEVDVFSVAHMVLDLLLMFSLLYVLCKSLKAF